MRSLAATRRWCSLVVVAALGACGGNNPFRPTVATVAGLYRAEYVLEFTSSDPNPVNLIENGASLILLLNGDGTTGGRLVIPAEFADGAPVDAELTGAWTLDGDTVRFEFPGVDVFLEDLAFDAGAAASGQLYSEGPSGGIIVRILLQNGISPE